jgi:hypothetical protein
VTGSHNGFPQRLRILRLIGRSLSSVQESVAPKSLAACGTPNKVEEMITARGKSPTWFYNQGFLSLDDGILTMISN